MKRLATLHTTILAGFLFFSPFLAYASETQVTPVLYSGTSYCISNSDYASISGIGGNGAYKVGIATDTPPWNFFDLFGPPAGSSGSGPNTMDCAGGYYFDMAPYASAATSSMEMCVSATNPATPSNGSCLYAIFTSGTPQPGGTRIDNVGPASGTTLATSTILSLSATGWLDSPDANSDEYLEWSITTPESCVACAGPSFTGQTLTYDLDLIPFPTGTAQSFGESTTTNVSLNTPGLYSMTTSIRRPSAVFFGLIPWSPSVVFSTTTTFIVGQTTVLDQTLAALGGGALVATTTAANLSACIPIPGYFILTNCLTTLFVPSANSLAMVQISQDKDLIMRKPPFGYFTSIGSLLDGMSTTSAASTTPAGISVLEDMFSPLRTGLSFILWFALFMWVFHRVRRWEFQA